MESMKQALRRIDAALCTTAATAAVTIDSNLDCTYSRLDVSAGCPLDAPEYLWRGSARPGALSSTHLVPRPDTCFPNF